LISLIQWAWFFAMLTGWLRDGFDPARVETLAPDRLLLHSRDTVPA